MLNGKKTEEPPHFQRASLKLLPFPNLTRIRRPSLLRTQSTHTKRQTTQTSAPTQEVPIVGWCKVTLDFKFFYGPAGFGVTGIHID